METFAMVTLLWSAVLLGGDSELRLRFEKLHSILCEMEARKRQVATESFWETGKIGMVFICKLATKPEPKENT